MRPQGDPNSLHISTSHLHTTLLRLLALSLVYTVKPMFNSSLRRAARTRPNGTLSTRPSTSSIAPFTSQSHQRRQSSSKPPIPPNNGSPTIPASSVKQVGASRESKRPGSESRRSKPKAAKAEQVEDTPQDNWTAALPSVPNVHLNKKGTAHHLFNKSSY
jgi:hypothetical protein